MKDRVGHAYSGGRDTSGANGARRSQHFPYDLGPATHDTGDTVEQSWAKGLSVLIGMPSELASAQEHRAGRGIG